MAAIPQPLKSSLPSASPQPKTPRTSAPLPKTRQSSIPSSATSTPTSSLPTLSGRTPSSSSIPATTSPYTPTNSSPLADSHSSGQPQRLLRKTISYNAFPRPPAGLRSPSAGHPPVPSAIPSTTSPLLNGATRSASSPISRAASASTMAENSSPVAADDTDTADSTRGRHSRSSTHGKDKGNVVISVRVRPEKGVDDDSLGGGEWMVEGKKSTISYRGKEGGEYIYDNVFTAHDKNEKVYNSAAKRLIRRVMEGYNGTVFAYGMTGTGKTYSMQGTHQHPGVTPLAITDIFSFIRETPQREFLLRVSYLEIYNEKIHDLLAPTAGDEMIGGQTETEIKLREDKNGHVYATPLKEEIVQSPTQLLRVIARGDQARKTSSTLYNARSSRSHAVVQIVVESRERVAGSGSTLDGKRHPARAVGTRISTLNLIDLAGSERAAETKERREEGSHINRSLLTLGTVISKLSGKKDKDGNPTDKQGKHLPYRDSKLTRLLQPALSGNSLISILCTIQLGSAGSFAAAGNHVVETLNTLKFAARARNNIVSHAKRSEDHANINDAGSRALLDRYAEEIRELRKQLESKNNESAKMNMEEEESRQEEERARNEEHVTELHLAQLALADRIRHLNAIILSSKSNGVNQQLRSQTSSFSIGQHRQSSMSNLSDTRSLRSSPSSQTLGAKSSKRLSDETANSPRSPADEEDEPEVNGYGDASKDAQIRALQADLSDKNRYIESLEIRLRQARRSSKSRVSMIFEGRQITSGEQGGVEVLLREKDAEISELREQLDDSQRALNALRSATRMRETLDAASSPLAPATASPPILQRNPSSHTYSLTGSQTSGGAGEPISGRLSRRTSAISTTTDGASSSNPWRSSILASRQSSTALNLRSATTSPHLPPTFSAPSPPSTTTISPSTSHQPLTLSSPDLALPQSPSLPLSPGSRALRPPRKRNHGVDDMTRLLDDMIRAKVEEEKADALREANGHMDMTTEPRRNSLNLAAIRDAGSGSGSRSPALKQRRAWVSLSPTPEVVDDLGISASSSSSSYSSSAQQHKRGGSRGKNGLVYGNVHGNRNGNGNMHSSSTSSSIAISNANANKGKRRQSLLNDGAIQSRRSKQTNGNGSTIPTPTAIFESPRAAPPPPTAAAASTPSVAGTSTTTSYRARAVAQIQENEALRNPPDPLGGGGSDDDAGGGSPPLVGVEVQKGEPVREGSSTDTVRKLQMQSRVL